MQCAPIKTIAALIHYSFFMYFFVINACHACAPTRSWLQAITGIDVYTHVPESGELLKAFGLAFGFLAVIRGMQQIEKIIIDLDKEDKRNQQSVRLYPTLYERIYRRRSLQHASEQELEEEKVNILARQCARRTTRHTRRAEQKVYSRPLLYDSTHETMNSGCLMLDALQGTRQLDPINSGCVVLNALQERTDKCY